MSPTTILIALLVITTMRAFLLAPENRKRVEAQARGGYKPEPTQSCLTMLILPAVLGLWWWYAIATDALLLGVVFTVGTVAALLGVALDNAAQKAVKR